jgi:hypothetical protein
MLGGDTNTKQHQYIMKLVRGVTTAHGERQPRELGGRAAKESRAAVVPSELRHLGHRHGRGATPLCQSLINTSIVFYKR